MKYFIIKKYQNQHVPNYGLLMEAALGKSHVRSHSHRRQEGWEPLHDTEMEDQRQWGPRAIRSSP